MPTWPFASEVVATVNVDDTIVNKNVAVALCGGVPVSVTWNVSVVPVPFDSVGVPLSCPVEGFSVNPPGNLPESSAHR